MGIAPYEPDWGTRQNMLEGRAAKRRARFVCFGNFTPFLLLWDILFFDVPPEKRGNLRPGKLRLGIEALAVIAL